MINIVGKNAYGVVEYRVSNESEVAELPKDGLVAQGSSCFVLETSNVYMYNAETNKWQLI
mgnify:FL=1